MSLPRHDWHAPILAALVNTYATNHHTPRYLEIGVDRGHTLWHMYTQTSAQMYGVDITLQHYLYGKSKRIQLSEETSDSFFKRQSELDPTAFDVIFIDGDHSAEQTWEDLFNSLALLRDNGVIAMHDTLPIKYEWVDSHCGTAYQTATRLYESTMLQVWTLPVFPGLTLVSKQYTPIIDF